MDFNITGAMKKSIAEAIWKRLEQYDFRFTTLLSDGDAKTFNHMVSLNIGSLSMKMEVSYV